MQSIVDIAKQAATNEGSYPSDGIYDELVATPKAYPALVPYERAFPQMTSEDSYTYTGDQTGRFAHIDRTGNRSWEEMEDLVKAWAKECLSVNDFFRLLAMRGYQTKLGGKNVRIMEVHAALIEPWDID